MRLLLSLAVLIYEEALGAVSLTGKKQLSVLKSEHCLLTQRKSKNILRYHP